MPRQEFYLTFGRYFSDTLRLWMSILGSDVIIPIEYLSSNYAMRTNRRRPCFRPGR